MLRVGGLGLGANLECRTMVTGEWSEDRSGLELAVMVCTGIHLTTAKSIRSGTFLLSLGQYVGSPVETCSRLAVCMALNNSRPLGEVSLDPHLVCFAL